MQILFDQAFDHGAWPGPVGGGGASFGEAWVGPGGLLGILETALGLGGPPVSETERIAALVPALRRVQGFWSESAAVDPIGTARRLLSWRRSLVECGWADEPVTPRIGALAQVTSHVPPGPADRLHTVCEALEARRADLEEVGLLEELDGIAPLWRRALQSLAKHGTRISTRGLPVVRAKGDLAQGRARGTGFEPQGDGSLQLFRPHAPLAAAETVAAWLAAQRAERVVVVGGDEILDGALRKFGLATIGATRSPQDSTLAQLVALVLAVGWSPPDPQRMLELLLLPLGPVPPGVGYHLMNALQEVPAVGSPEWKDALQEGLNHIEDVGRRARVEKRLDALLAPRVPHVDRYPIAEVRLRLAALSTWLRAQSATDETNREALFAPLAQIGALERLLASSGIDAFGAAELQHFVGESARAFPGAPGLDAQAGLGAVATPDAVAGPAEIVVWWGFTRESAPTVARQPFTDEELKALARAGVLLPDRGSEAVALSRRWRRPLEQTEQTLLLVCPERDEGGEAVSPHPLWDEIAANVTKGGDLGKLVMSAPGSRVGVAASSRPSKAIPKPTAAWRVAKGAIRKRDQESPSGAGMLIGCPLGWVLTYAAKLEPGRSATLPTGNQLKGSLVHELLATLLPDPKSTRADAARLFRERGPMLAAELFLPGAERERAAVERTLVESAGFLLDMLRRHNMHVKSVEETHTGTGLGTKLTGRTDLVLEPPLAVVDLKLSGESYFRKALSAGTAYQLAAYARLVRKGGKGPLPPVAYFVLRSQNLITTDKKTFPEAEHVQGPTAAETWKATEQAYATALARLEKGEISALGVEEAPPEDGLENEVLTLAPPCHFCGFDALCAVAFSEAP